MLSDGPLFCSICLAASSFFGHPEAEFTGDYINTDLNTAATWQLFISQSQAPPLSKLPRPTKEHAHRERMCHESRGRALREQFLSLDFAGTKAILGKEHLKTDSPPTFLVFHIDPMLWRTGYDGSVQRVYHCECNRLHYTKVCGYFLKSKINMKLLSFLVLKKIPFAHTSFDTFFLGVNLLWGPGLLGEPGYTLRHNACEQPLPHKYLETKGWELLK